MLEVGDIEKKAGRRRAWIYVGLMMGLILIVLPITPILWRTGTRIFGARINSVGYVISVLAFLWIVIYLVRRWSAFGPFRFLLIAGLACVYFYLLRFHCKFPAEQLHLVEYGLLVYFLYRALRIDFSKTTSYAVSFLISSGYGFLDEVIQYVLPNRFFEIRDLMTNLMASALGLLAVALLTKARPPETSIPETDG